MRALVSFKPFVRMLSIFDAFIYNFIGFNVYQLTNFLLDLLVDRNPALSPVRVIKLTHFRKILPNIFLNYIPDLIRFPQLFILPTFQQLSGRRTNGGKINVRWMVKPPIFFLRFGVPSVVSTDIPVKLFAECSVVGILVKTYQGSKCKSKCVWTANWNLGMAVLFCVHNVKGE